MKFINGQLSLDSSITGTTALFTSGLTVSGGNVGVGTDTPTSKLFIYTNNTSSTIGDNNAFIIHNNNPNWATSGAGNLTELFFSDAGQGAGTTNGLNLNHRYAGISAFITGWNSGSSAGGLNFITKETTASTLDIKLQIKPNGNVLIGTTTDAGFKLSVSGSTLLRGSGTTSASYALATQNSSGGTTMVVNNAGNMLIGTTTDAGYRLDVNGTTRLGNLTLANGSILLGDVGGTRVFNTAGLAIDYGTIYPFSITGSGTITITPAGILTLKGVTHTYSATETYVVQKTTHIGHLQINFDISGSDATAYNYGTISGNVRIYPGEQSNGNGYGSVVLGHNGINQRGSVLIGTITNNNSRLLIGGTVSGATLSTTRATHINATLLATGNTTTLIGLDIQPTFTTGSFTGLTQLALRVSGGTQIIGSGSTGTTLSVFSVDGSSGRLFDVSDDLSSTLFSVNTIAGLPVIEAFANSSVVLGKYGQNTLVVSGTSVGIGTNATNGKLIVKGSGTTSGSTTVLIQNSATTTTLIINDAGNIGIGTSSPQAKLDVNGTMLLGSLSGDPSGSNGMIYYNTTTNKFRGYENGAWANLI